MLLKLPTAAVDSRAWGSTASVGCTAAAVTAAGLFVAAARTMLLAAAARACIAGDGRLAAPVAALTVEGKANGTAVADAAGPTLLLLAVDMTPPAGAIMLAGPVFVLSTDTIDPGFVAGCCAAVVAAGVNTAAGRWYCCCCWYRALAFHVGTAVGMAETPTAAGCVPARAVAGADEARPPPHKGPGYDATEAAPDAVDAAGTSSSSQYSTSASLSASLLLLLCLNILASADTACAPLLSRLAKPCGRSAATATPEGAGPADSEAACGESEGRWDCGMLLVLTEELAGSVWIVTDEGFHIELGL